MNNFNNKSIKKIEIEVFNGILLAEFYLQCKVRFPFLFKKKFMKLLFNQKNLQFYSL